MKPKAIIFDRDGVLNRLWHEPDLGTVDSPARPEQVRLMPGAAEAVARITSAGVPCAIASNQPGVAKGKMTARLLGQVTRTLLDRLEAEGGRIDHVFYCLHHPDASVTRLRVDCPDRKPRPGLLLKAAAVFGAAPADCWFIGDTGTDVRAGRAAGCRTAWLGSARCDRCPTLAGTRPDLIADNLPDLVGSILDKDF